MHVAYLSSRIYFLAPGLGQASIEIDRSFPPFRSCVSAPVSPQVHVCYELATVPLEPRGPNTDCIATPRLASSHTHTHTHTLSLSLSLCGSGITTTHTAPCPAPRAFSPWDVARILSYQFCKGGPSVELGIRFRDPQCEPSSADCPRVERDCRT